jgi:hypothetical protein
MHTTVVARLTTVANAKAQELQNQHPVTTAVSQPASAAVNTQKICQLPIAQSATNQGL